MRKIAVFVVVVEEEEAVRLVAMVVFEFGDDVAVMRRALRVMLAFVDAGFDLRIFASHCLGANFVDIDCCWKHLCTFDESGCHFDFVADDFS